MDMDDVNRFASEHGLWVVEDGAHAIPAAWRRGPDDPWRRCGEGTAAITCFFLCEQNHNYRRRRHGSHQ